MHNSFDSLFEVNLTYCTRVLPLKRCGKIQLGIFFYLSVKLEILLIIYPNLSNPTFKYLFTVKVFLLTNPSSNRT